MNITYLYYVVQIVWEINIAKSCIYQWDKIIIYHTLPDCIFMLLCSIHQWNEIKWIYGLCKQQPVIYNGFQRRLLQTNYTFFSIISLLSCQGHWNKTLLAGQSNNNIPIANINCPRVKLPLPFFCDFDGGAASPVPCSSDYDCDISGRERCCRNVCNKKTCIFIPDKR